ncbi:hypothetical protein CC78DRAFT_580254 [Lojkania enalia]|uniref:Uncharacterized protein n=1 Tax=Lojkania enalia TaxID=147567 RepID=A0A9P4K9C3_9PLEO|nr:hypothetical protein CC78DRAFT_580254 [Didymosphaeria enalia]
MRFQSLAVLALSTAAFAAERRQVEGFPSDPAAISVLNVLATALPSSVLSEALADPTSFASAVASSIAAGNTPSWILALPTEVQSLLPSLYPVETPASTTEAPLTTPPPVSSPSAGTITGPPGNSTGGSTFNSPTPSATDGAPSSSQSGNGAAAPTAVIGAGIAGAIGLLGMLVL